MINIHTAYAVFMGAGLAIFVFGCGLLLIDLVNPRWRNNRVTYIDPNTGEPINEGHYFNGRYQGPRNGRGNL